MLLDVKTGAEMVFQAVHELLESYQATEPQVFTAWFDGDGGSFTKKQGAIKAIVSGSKPSPEWTVLFGRTKKGGRLLGLDFQSSVDDLRADTFPNSVFPLVSHDFKDAIGGVDHTPTLAEITPGQHAKISAFVEAAHAKARPLRFWSTDDSEEMWDMLAGHGVDLINTDHLPELRAYLTRGVGDGAVASPTSASDAVTTRELEDLSAKVDSTRVGVATLSATVEGVGSSIQSVIQLTNIRLAELDASVTRLVEDEEDARVGTTVGHGETSGGGGSRACTSSSLLVLIGLIVGAGVGMLVALAFRLKPKVVGGSRIEMHDRQDMHAY